MNNKSYFKLINLNTGDETYATGSEPISEEALLELLGLDGYSVERITEEEYHLEMDEQMGVIHIYLFEFVR